MLLYNMHAILPFSKKVDSVSHRKILLERGEKRDVFVYCFLLLVYFFHAKIVYDSRTT